MAVYAPTPGVDASSTAASLEAHRSQLMGRGRAEQWEERVHYLAGAGVPGALARRSAHAADMAIALPVIDAADTTGAKPTEVASAFAALGFATFDVGRAWTRAD